MPCLKINFFLRLRGFILTDFFLGDFLELSRSFGIPNKEHKLPQHHNTGAKKEGQRQRPADEEGGGGKLGWDHFGARGV